MKQRVNGDWIVEAEPFGYMNEVLFDAGPMLYGNTNNGIKLQVCGRWWVISFEDFEQMYELAKKARGNT